MCNTIPLRATTPPMHAHTQKGRNPWNTQYEMCNTLPVPSLKALATRTQDLNQKSPNTLSKQYIEHHLHASGACAPVSRPPVKRHACEFVLMRMCTHIPGSACILHITSAQEFALCSLSVKMATQAARHKLVSSERYTKCTKMFVSLPEDVQ